MASLKKFDAKFSLELEKGYRPAYDKLKCFSMCKSITAQKMGNCLWMFGIIVDWIIELLPF